MRRGNRRSIRLKGFDYRRAGAYFVTVVTQGRLCLFGDVVGDAVRLSAAGAMVRRIWQELATPYPGVRLDKFVVMPNHLHGIIVLGGATMGMGTTTGTGATTGGRPCGLPDVVHRFKSFTTACYRHGVDQLAWPPFPGRLWQRNYYERILRDARGLAQIRNYIRLNPSRWAKDRARSPC